MNRYYTGVGSRETPKDILKQMRSIASRLSQDGFILRSGGAPGADSAFESGVRNGMADIYLPWPGFEKRYGDGYITPNTLRNWEKAEQIARKIHPIFDDLTQGTQKLHTCNVFQVLGKDLKTPSDFLICWAKPLKGGRVDGGTGTAVALARKYDIPVINLYV